MSCVFAGIEMSRRGDFARHLQFTAQQGTLSPRQGKYSEMCYLRVNIRIRVAYGYKFDSE
jgi:hypothetical protein